MCLYMIKTKALPSLQSVMLLLAENFDHQHVVDSEFVMMSRWLCELAKCKDQHHIYEALRPCFVTFQVERPFNALSKRCDSRESWIR